MASAGMEISIEKDFSRVPGGRNITDGPHSGEDFLNKHLAPAVENARKNHSIVKVILDGTRGYGPSFLEEVFGGIVRIIGNVAEAKKIILIVSKDRPRYLEDIEYYMEHALDDIKKNSHKMNQPPIQDKLMAHPIKRIISDVER